jgi:hypothetical protein
MTRPITLWGRPVSRWLAAEWAVRIALPLVALLVEGWPTMLGTLLIQELGLWMARRLSADSRTGAAFFLSAWSLRGFLAAILHGYLMATKGSGAVLQDDYTYDLVAHWLARIAYGDGLSVFPGHQHLLLSFYVYILAGIYSLLGYTPLLPKLLNAGLGALSVALIADVTARAYRPSAGRVAGIGALVLPSLVLWSGVTLKEMLVLFAIVACLRALQALSETAGGYLGVTNALVALAAAGAVVADLRFPIFLILMALIPVALLGRVGHRITRGQLLLGAAALAVAGVVFFNFARTRAPESTLTKLTDPGEMARLLSQRRTNESVDANSSLFANTEVSLPDVVDVPGFRDEPPFSLVEDVLRPMQVALLSPAPWQVHSLRDLGVSAEMLIWYVFIVGSVVAWAARPRERLYVGLVALYGVTTWLLLGLAEGNLGNLLRHRMMLVPTFLILGGGGLSWLWARLRGLHVPARLPASAHSSVRATAGGAD